MLFVVKGKEGAVQFLLYTNWHLKHVRKEQDQKILVKAMGAEPRAEITNIRGAILGDPEKLGKTITELEKAFGRISGELDQTDLNVTYHPMPADLGYHSRVPMYEGQTPMGSQKKIPGAIERNLKIKDASKWEPVYEQTDDFHPCKWLDGAPCYYDGSGLNAEPVFELLIEKGSDAVWEYLENYYEEVFHGRRNNIPSTEKHDAQDN